MSSKFKILEVTKDNEKKYIDGVVNLEDTVYADMIRQGKIGQLFTTGREDIIEYIRSKNNAVFVATIMEEEAQNESEKSVVATAYITHGQVPYTYNDITKYFKYGKQYEEYVKSKYNSQTEYLNSIRNVYIQKIKAFVYARDFILEHKGIDVGQSEKEKNEEFLKLVEMEQNNPENQFHEKSDIRELLNEKMSTYMLEHGLEKEYDRFYWVDMDFIRKQHEQLKSGSEEIKENMDSISVIQESKYDTTIKAYDKILSMQKYRIYGASDGLELEKYFGANTRNTIELDTYLTSNVVRENGLARIIVYEGIKKFLQSEILQGNEKSVFLVSTIHQDNFSSKYVSEFLGLQDNLFVNRRVGRDREVHICRIERENVKKYLSDIEKKLAVLYDYNPHNINISESDRRNIMVDQLKYETKNLKKLRKLWRIDVAKRNVYVPYIRMKARKVAKLQKDCAKLSERAGR